MKIIPVNKFMHTHTYTNIPKSRGVLFLLVMSRKKRGTKTTTIKKINCSNKVECFVAVEMY